MPVMSYTITLERVIGSGQILCPLVRDKRPAETYTRTRSKIYTGLEEFSVYMVTVIATFSEQSLNSSVNFTTFSALPSAAPYLLSSFIGPRSVILQWDIACSERNGYITNLMVDFQEQGGAPVPGSIVGHNFTATGLTPATVYVVIASGINVNGTGPTHMGTISTIRDSMFVIIFLLEFELQNVLYTQLLVQLLLSRL